MKEFCKTLEGLSLGVKIILAIPILDIIWVIYRVVKSASDEDTVGMILAIILIIIGIPWLWLVDMICIIAKGNVLWVNFKN